MYCFCPQVCLFEGVRSPGTGATDSCELPCGCWELNPGPLEEHPVLNCWAISAALNVNLQISEMRPWLPYAVVFPLTTLNHLRVRYFFCFCGKNALTKSNLRNKELILAYGSRGLGSIMEPGSYGIVAAARSKGGRGQRQRHRERQRHTETETDTQTHRDRDRHTDTQRQRQRQTHRDRDRDRHTETETEIDTDRQTDRWNEAMNP